VIYELREYTAAPGCAARLHDRFRNHVLQLFQRHGLDPAGFWTDAADPDRVLYLLRFPDEETRTAAWAAFRADPEWQTVKAESEAAGPIVAEMTSRMLGQPPYWGMTTVAPRADTAAP
jgi:hypothetical protein